MRYECWEAGFDQFVSGLDYPMFVVTAAADGRRAGCLVGFVTLASIDPARLLVCVSTTNATHAVAARADVLGVHLLRADQFELAALFGSTTGDDTDKFSRCTWSAGPGGVPLLTDCPRWMLGRIEGRLELGDHVGFLLDPISIAATAGPVLTFQQLRGLPPGHPA